MTEPRGNTNHCQIGDTRVYPPDHTGLRARRPKRSLQIPAGQLREVTRQ